MTVTDTPITITRMRPHLLTLNQARDILATTEPLATIDFEIGDDVRYFLDDGWHHGIEAKAGTQPVDARIILGRGTTEIPLTKDALLEATSICGISKNYAARCPANLLEPQLNYWFREGLAARRGIHRFQLLVAADTGAAITRATIQPFSNLRLLDEATDGIAHRFPGEEILVDYKLTHTLRRTHLRLVIPGRSRTLTGTGTDDDTWSIGLQIKNSLIGEERTSIDGYLFRWICTNGAIDTNTTSGVWSRRGNTKEQEVYEWARAAVDNILGGMESALDGVQGLAAIPIEGQANEVLRDVFDHYRTPLPERAKIIEAMIEAGDLTMYTVMAAITQTANDPDLEPSHVESLLRMGGDLPHAATSRCEACRRMLPH